MFTLQTLLTAGKNKEQESSQTFVQWNHLSNFSGYDEFRIFNKALSEEEIAALKNL